MKLVCDPNEPALLRDVKRDSSRGQDDVIYLLQETDEPCTICKTDLVKCHILGGRCCDTKFLTWMQIIWVCDCVHTVARMCIH